MHIPSDSIKMKLNRYFFPYWLPVIIWMVVIFWMSTGTFSSEQTSRFIVPLLHFLFPRLAPQDVDLIHGLIRKSGHVAEYFVLGLLLYRAFRATSSRIWRLQWAGFALIVVTLFAASDELHQSFVASRTPSLVDVGIDLVGGILSQSVIMLRGKIVGYHAKC
jgi:VanZ family protein